LGGFGISRFTFDHFLFESAKKDGVQFILGKQIDDIEFSGDTFHVRGSDLQMKADVVVGSFGKRSVLDVSLDRKFIKKRSPYLGVKYHVRFDQPSDLISLHNFSGGYCGISKVEGNQYNLCYLTHRDNLRRFGSIPAMEENILQRNPKLKCIFKNSEFLLEKPETINEISFETKGPVENHILMTGDSAGMITPLCGNGMAMAMQSSFLVVPFVDRFCNNDRYSRSQMEHDYARAWKSAFAKRLWIGRQIQKLFGGERTSNTAVAIAAHLPPLAEWLVKQTHGKPF
jgi:flavin-dependent dehydrogenase